ncbi:DUF58 domain-containing protein [Apibacter muscae]|uniref:DUF58 domain-containing protein n=1 Tax=Apibacter muscae TaxID=2509004 RepID=A0A563DFX0_9FLAO|nr:DUF58 domain-containing protein [Apibacter muscae]TWP29075.1 DUF58 domain-containing protein [Apibacter muscae]
MLKFFKSLYLTQRLFLILLGFVLAFILANFIEPLFILVKYLFLLYFLAIIADMFLLYLVKNGIRANRLLPEKFSNGDDNPVHITFENLYNFHVSLSVIDEIPIQFQIRNFLFKVKLKKGECKEYTYQIHPTKRGVYKFGKLNVYAESILGLVKKRYIFEEGKDIAVYPSFLQLQKYDLLAFTNRLHEYGVKKIRKVGNTMEFEQIRDYVYGDDIRNINWKATAKRNQLMINQFQDERSQPVYSVIDKGRVMLMPFNGLSLLDYSINASLVISNVALQKNDKAGLFTFSRKIENKIVAERRKSQMELILNTLYNIRTDFAESDFGRLYGNIKRTINQRSLILLFTNFENMDSMQRQLPYLKAIANNHLLIVIFFKNVELKKLIHQPAKNTREIYQKVIAEKFAFDKELIVKELKKNGIQSILTEPEKLTINTINKYLELKARGTI